MSSAVTGTLHAPRPSAGDARRSRDVGGRRTQGAPRLGESEGQ